MYIHTVVQGDSIWQIAQRYGSDANQIILVNGLDDPNVLVVGQSIVVPDPQREYVVQPGDNLWEIAQRYGVTAEDLGAYNSIYNLGMIFVGDLLVIPNVIHTVQPGETLWQIAANYGTTINQIVQVNNLADPSMLFPGQQLRIPVSDRPVKEVNAYTTRTDQEGAEEVAVLGRNLTYLSPFMYSMREDGSLTNLQDELLIQVAWANNVHPLLVLTNFQNNTFDSDLAAAVLRNPAIQERLLDNILQVIRQKGYTGLNIDFEYVYPEDRENYNNFLRRAAARLHPEGFTLSTALAPKESADQQGLLYEAHDYAAHGEIADFVVLMTYEWGWAGGEPWAIAPINKVRDVLDYAVTVISPEKILMGAPLYGRDWNIPWVEGTTARTVGPREAVELAWQYGAAIEYDETYQSPYFRYWDETGQQHEVWFEDARSMQAKYETVKEYGLRGVSYWSLGYDFPENWAVLQDQFRVRKL